MVDMTHFPDPEAHLEDVTAPRATKVKVRYTRADATEGVLRVRAQSDDHETLVGSDESTGRAVTVAADGSGWVESGV